MRLRHLCGIISLSALLFSPAHAQPHLSLQIQRLDLKGNLLRLADGHFLAEKEGELFRLTPDAQFERKLDFDPTRPFAGITGAQTEFSRLLASRKSGGFLASVNLYIPGFGWIEQRLTSFDADGRLDSSVDTSDALGSFIAAAIELPNGWLLYTLDNPEGDSLRAAVIVQPTGEAGEGRWSVGTGLLGSARALAVQGSNIVVGGNLVSDFSSPMETNGLFRLNALPNPDSSFRAPRCKDISQLAVQSDGRILARGRLADGQGSFESDISVFQLNADGSFGQRLVRVPDSLPPPLFSVAGDDKIIILNADEFLRFSPDGSLTERGHIGSGGPFDNLDGVELLPDGSFLAHWYYGDLDLGGLCFWGNRNHWLGFNADGSLNPTFPPAPLDSARIDVSIENMQTGHTYTIEQSRDLIHWEDILGNGGWVYGDNGSVQQVNLGCGIRITEPRFFRAKEIPGP